MILRAHRALVAVFAAVLALGLGATVVAGSSSAATATATKHYVANVSGSYAAAAALGYNVLDVSSVSSLGTLPAGTQAMFWLGSGQKCPTPVDSTFTAKVDQLVPNAAKVYGVYLSDEPEVTACANGPANVKARVDYVKSKLPSVKTFIVIDNQGTFYPYRPAVTSVELVGIDPYPFNKNNPGTADPASHVNSRVGWATAGGWPKSSIVPTFQLFGQEGTASCTTTDGYYRFPSDAELNQLLGAWQAAGPFSELDYSYGWKNQPGTACPTLADKPSAQQIMKAYFAGSPAPAPSTSTPAPQVTSSTVSSPPAQQTATVTVTKTVTETVTPAVSSLQCSLPPNPSPGDTTTCAYR